MTPPKPLSDSPTFEDAAGRRWRLAVTIGRAREIKQITGVDFANLADGQFFLRLRESAETFAQVLWLLCESQAQAANPPVTPAQFGEALDGDALDAAREAIQQAAINFTPASRRGAVAAALRTLDTAEAEAMAAIEEWTTNQRPELIANVRSAAHELLAKHGSESPS